MGMKKFPPRAFRWPHNWVPHPAMVEEMQKKHPGALVKSWKAFGSGEDSWIVSEVTVEADETGRGFIIYASYWDGIATYRFNFTDAEVVWEAAGGRSAGRQFRRELEKVRKLTGRVKELKDTIKNLEKEIAEDRAKEAAPEG